LVNKGNGTNYGIELSVEKQFARHYYFTWNTSVYKATYHTLEGIKRNTPYNGSFTAHLLAGREFRFGKRQGQHQITINGRTVWNGGKRYIPIDLEASVQENRQVPDISQAYVHRLSNYFRLDLQAAYRLNSKWFMGEVRMDILNVTNHQAPLTLFYHVQTQQILKQPQLGIYPVVSYRMEF
jgi:outer membrane receptor protein involved in Fe transport